MHDVNWVLMAVAFVLGLLLTLAMMIRRVTREVPVIHTVSAAVRAPHVKEAAGAATAAAAALHGAAGKVEKKIETVEKKVEKKVVTAVEKIRGEDVLEVVPYGSGSIRVTARTVGPAGYTIKGDKDTGRYFTPDSPEYEAIEAEVWFANEESAQKAGFLRWDAKSGKTAGLVSADAAAVITEHHVQADTVITEKHDADASLIVVDGGSATTDSAALVASAAGVGPYGTGSSPAGADGSGPAGWLVKGNADSMLFHGPDSPAYEQTIAEVWFVDEATAQVAGFKRWDTNFR